MKNKHRIIWMERVDSTNDEARRHISDIANLSVVSALSQTDGRGQRGNSWSSEPGKNLLFSIAVRFGSDKVEPIKAYDQFVISEIAALTVVDFLATYGIEAKVKWPNDIYVDDRKICGILIENSLEGSELKHSIIGIGLNINQRNFDVTLPNPTSMAICQDNMTYDIHICMEELMDIFTDYLERYCHIKGGYGRLRKMYLAQMWRIDEAARFIDRTGTEPIEFSGIIKGLSDIGQLIVETEKGELREFAFKEISYII